MKVKECAKRVLEEALRNFANEIGDARDALLDGDMDEARNHISQAQFYNGQIAALEYILFDKEEYDTMRMCDG